MTPFRVVYKADESDFRDGLREWFEGQGETGVMFLSSLFQNGIIFF